VKGKFETEEQISQLDDLVSKSEEISPAVDDLVSCMYPPMNKDAVRSAVSLHSVFVTCKKVIQDDHRACSRHGRILKFTQNCIWKNWTTETTSENNIKINLKDIGFEDTDRILWAYNRVHC
jgi:hypothetical protein